MITTISRIFDRLLGDLLSAPPVDQLRPGA
jgi:hypothetical protein